MKALTSKLFLVNASLISSSVTVALRRKKKSEFQLKYVFFWEKIQVDCGKSHFALKLYTISLLFLLLDFFWCGRNLIDRFIRHSKLQNSFRFKISWTAKASNWIVTPHLHPYPNFTTLKNGLPSHCFPFSFNFLINLIHHFYPC